MVGTIKHGRGYDVPVKPFSMTLTNNRDFDESQDEYG